MLFLSGSAHATKFQIFHDNIRPHSTLMVSTENAAIRRLYIGLRVRYKYYKKMVVLVWPGAAHVPITV